MAAGASTARRSGPPTRTTAHYMIALVRTSGTHRGPAARPVAVPVDLKLPGITVRPIEDLTGDDHFNEVFFDDVELAARRADRRRRRGLGAGDRRARLRAQRARAALLEHRAVRRVARASARDAARATRRRSRSLGRIVGAAARRCARCRWRSRRSSPRRGARWSRRRSSRTSAPSSSSSCRSRSATRSPARRSTTRRRRCCARSPTSTQIAPTFSLRGGTREILRGMIARGLGLR